MDRSASQTPEHEDDDAVDIVAIAKDKYGHLSTLTKLIGSTVHVIVFPDRNVRLRQLYAYENDLVVKKGNNEAYRLSPGKYHYKSPAQLQQLGWKLGKVAQHARLLELMSKTAPAGLLNITPVTAKAAA